MFFFYDCLPKRWYRRQIRSQTLSARIIEVALLAAINFDLPLMHRMARFIHFGGTGHVNSKCHTREQ